MTPKQVSLHRCVLLDLPASACWAHSISSHLGAALDHWGVLRYYTLQGAHDLWIMGVKSSECARDGDAKTKGWRWDVPNTRLCFWDSTDYCCKCLSSKTWHYLRIVFIGASKILLPVWRLVPFSGPESFSPTVYWSHSYPGLWGWYECGICGTSRTLKCFIRSHFSSNEFI